VRSRVSKAMRVPYAELRRLLRDASQLQRIRARGDDCEPLYVEIEATSRQQIPSTGCSTAIRLKSIKEAAICVLVVGSDFWLERPVGRGSFGRPILASGWVARDDGRRGTFIHRNAEGLSLISMTVMTLYASKGARTAEKWRSFTGCSTMR
jgi:hypothetical protein